MSGRGDEITTKFKVDISDLKAGITKANQEIKLANAQFKAASAGMDDWKKSTEGIQAKLQQLDSVLASQKSKLQSYQEQLQRQQDAYNENGKRAEDLKNKLQQLASQGVEKTSEEYKQYQKALNDVEKEQLSNEKAMESLKVTILNQQAAVNSTEKEIRNYNAALDNMESEAAQAADATNKQKNAYESLQSTIDKQQSELNELKNKYSNVVLEQGKNSESAQKLASEIDKLSSELNENKSKLGEADKAAEELDRSFEELEDSSEKASDGFTVMRGALASLVADGIRRALTAMKDFVVGSIEVGKNFDSSMSQVAAVSGATGDDLEQLRDKAKEMGAATKFSASEAADAFNFMAMAGWKTADMLSGIEGILSLAAAGNTDLATTSDIVTDALTAFGMAAQDAGRFADVIAAASSNANTNVLMLGESFKYVAPVAGALGYSAEDTSIALGLMANSGIKSSQAGTALRTVLTNMAKPTDTMAWAMRALGVSLADADGKSYSLMEIMQQLRRGFSGGQITLEEYEASFVKLLNEFNAGNMNAKAFKQEVRALEIQYRGLEEAQKAELAASLAGKEGMSGLLSIVNASEEDFQKLTDAIYNSEGAALKMSKIMQDNLGGDLTQLGSKFEGVQIKMYEKFEPALRSGVSVLSKLLDALSWVIDHAETLTTVIQVAGAAVGTFLIYMNWSSIMSAAAAALNGVRTAILAVNAAIAANPIGLLLAGIAALVVAIINLVKKLKEEKNAIKDTQKAQEDLTKAKKAAADAELDYVGAVDRATDAQRALEEAERASGLSGKALFDQIQQGTLDYAELNDEQKEVYKAYLENEAAQRAVEESTENLTKAKQAETFASLENQLALKKETQDYDTFKKSVVAAFNEGKISAEEARQLISAAMTDMSKSAQKTFIEDLPSNIKDGLNTNLYELGAQKLVSWFGTKWDEIKNKFENAPQWFSEKFGSAWTNIKETFAGWGQYWGSLWEQVKNKFSDLGTKLGDAIGGAVKGGINKVIGLIEGALNKAIGLINGAIGLINNIPGVKIGKINKLSLPRLAQGGVLKKGQIGLLEGSGAEAVVPLEKNKQWIRAVANDLKQQMLNNGMGAFGGGNLTNNREYNFTQIINAPKQPSRIELYRQTRNLLAYANAQGGV